jgi:hypothetical protein
MWRLKDLMESAQHTSTEVNGKWVPSRPINWQCRTIKERVREAWMVFMGEADAVIWPEGQ